MIQRIQSLYLLGSIIVCVIMYFLPLGFIESETVIKFSVCGFYEDVNMIKTNWILSSILSITLLVQIIALFMFNNRPRQAMLSQVSLILILLFAVIALLYKDLFSISNENGLVEEDIQYNWNIILIAISWILTYMALRAIKKDEALVRAADRMR